MKLLAHLVSLTRANIMAPFGRASRWASPLCLLAVRCLPTTTKARQQNCGPIKPVTWFTQGPVGIRNTVSLCAYCYAATVPSCIFMCSVRNFSRRPTHAYPHITFHW